MPRTLAWRCVRCGHIGGRLTLPDIPPVIEPVVRMYLRKAGYRVTIAQALSSDTLAEAFPPALDMVCVRCLDAEMVAAAVLAQSPNPPVEVP